MVFGREVLCPLCFTKAEAVFLTTKYEKAFTFMTSLKGKEVSFSDLMKTLHV